MFSGPCVTFEDDRFDYGEERLVTLGLVAGRMVVAAHAPRDEERETAVKDKSIKSDLAHIDAMNDAESTTRTFRLSANRFSNGPQPLGHRRKSS